HAFFAALRQRRQLTVIADIAAPGETAATGLFDQAKRLPQSGFLNIRQGQPGALPGIAQRQLAPQSTARSGYHYSHLFVIPPPVSTPMTSSHSCYLSQSGD